MLTVFFPPFNIFSVVENVLWQPRSPPFTFFLYPGFWHTIFGNPPTHSPYIQGWYSRNCPLSSYSFISRIYILPLCLYFFPKYPGMTTQIPSLSINIQAFDIQYLRIPPPTIYPGLIFLKPPLICYLYTCLYPGFTYRPSVSISSPNIQVWQPKSLLFPLISRLLTYHIWEFPHPPYIQGWYAWNCPLSVIFILVYIQYLHTVPLSVYLPQISMYDSPDPLPSLSFYIQAFDIFGNPYTHIPMADIPETLPYLNTCLYPGAIHVHHSLFLSLSSQISRYESSDPLHLLFGHPIFGKAQPPYMYIQGWYSRPRGQLCHSRISRHERPSLGHSIGWHCCCGTHLLFHIINNLDLIAFQHPNHLLTSFLHILWQKHPPSFAI